LYSYGLSTLWVIKERIGYFLFPPVPLPVCRGGAK